MTTKQVSMNLRQLKNFVDKFEKKTMLYEATKEMEAAIVRTLASKIFVSSINDIYEIDSSGEMRALIKSGGTPRKGSYNWEYARTKIVDGTPPHVQSGKTKDSVFVQNMGDLILFGIPDDATSRIHVSKTGNVSFGNFGQIHEKRKSILKATFVLGWQDIMFSVGKVYEEGAKSA